MNAFIFDCFGVIITDALEAILTQQNLGGSEKEAQIVALITAANRGQLAVNDSRTQIAGLLGMSHDDYMKRLNQGETKDQRVLDFVVSLRPAHKTALLSNVSPGGLSHRFAPGELATYFDIVVASSDIGYAKPEAQAYEITAARLGVRLSECIMIDDREEYCMGARSVGMHAILYQSFEGMKREIAEHYLAV